MEKILITGFSGFVASHFLDYLYSIKKQAIVLGVDVKKPLLRFEMYRPTLDIRFEMLDLMNIDALDTMLKTFNPDYVLHLAAFSSVAYSWEHPSECFINNSNIFLNLINTIRKRCPQSRVLSVGSSEEYGNVRHEDIPIKEEQPFNPVSPYAVARVSQEWMSKVYVNAYNMNIIMTRSFNHIGPRQDERFVIPSFIKQIKRIKQAGYCRGEIETGRLDIVRDFVDVRDVVHAYYLLLQDGIPGEVYNICSGKGVTLSEILQMIANEMGVKISARINQNFVRPKDNLEIIGSNYKIWAEVGWKPTISLKDTLRDMIVEK